MLKLRKASIPPMVMRNEPECNIGVKLKPSNKVRHISAL